MRAVRIAELKSRLSEYLRAVRNGETISVLDRETPVAHIVPVREGVALRIRKPAPGTPPPNRVRLPKPLKLRLRAKLTSRTSNSACVVNELMDALIRHSQQTGSIASAHFQLPAAQ
jgi:prevent-host-death family protein